jgi:iron complex transport system permease protein
LLKRLGRRGSRLSAGLWFTVGTVYAAGGRSFPANTLAMLNARYGFADTASTGSITTNIEELLTRCREADVVIYPTSFISGLDDILKELPELSAIKAFKTGRVYAYRETIYQLGYYDTEGYVRGPRRNPPPRDIRRPPTPLLCEACGMITEQRHRARRGAVAAGLTAAVAAVFTASVALGSPAVQPAEALQALLGGASETANTIVNTVRLPRVLAALMCGAALGVSGALLQTLFRNPMADPYILGVSSGSVLAIGVALLAAPLLGITPSSIPSLYTAAFLGAFAVTLLMTSISGIVRSVTTVLVVGVMLGYLSYAATSILAVLADIERIRAFTYWVFGSFSGSRWSLLTPAIPALAASLTLIALLAKQLNALLLGEEYARSMGMHIGAVRVLAVAAAAFPVSVVTTVAGPIGFIGLSAPYLARQLTQTSDHHTTIPFSALVGALLTASADLAARMLLRPVELPVTAVTALFGSPLIIYLLLKGRGVFY